SGWNLLSLIRRRFVTNLIRQISLRPTAWLVGVLALALSISTVALVHQYGATRPSVMDARRTHAVKIHDRGVDFTTGEYATAFASHVLTIVAIVSFLGVLLKSKARKS